MELHKIAIDKGWSSEDIPEWGNNSLYLNTISSGYLLEEETPKQGYQRIAKSVVDRLGITKYKDKDLESELFNIMWRGWLIPSTPVMSNMGTDRGLPISCFSGVVNDDMHDINRKCTEMSILSKFGGGTAYDFSSVRPIGSPIDGGKRGVSDGIIPFMKAYDSWILASKQGQLRRGATALYLNSNHKEYLDFLRVREPKGDINRQCHAIHQGSIWEDSVMQQVERILDKPKNKRTDKENSIIEPWVKTLMTRVKTGEPYTFFIDNANKATPNFWKKLGLYIRHSNLCAEINLPTDAIHTLVCCLSSMNIFKYDEWKNTDAVEFAIVLLDGVIQEFIDKAESIKGIEDAVRFAKKSRALGLGALGWHSFLKSKMVPFASIIATAYTRTVFSNIRTKAEQATQTLAKSLGEPEWCKNQGVRNLTLMAIAPNRSSAKLAGGLSQGIEPTGANIYTDDDPKGTYIRRDTQLEEFLETKGLNTPKIWDVISNDKGSVINIKDLTEDEKDVFRTFKEINQLEIVRQAAVRQKYIDQGQSLNLAFMQDAPAEWINKVHVEAWKLGIKALYYLRSSSNLRADSGGNREFSYNQRDLYNECLACEG